MSNRPEIDIRATIFPFVLKITKEDQEINQIIDEMKIEYQKMTTPAFHSEMEDKEMFLCAILLYVCTRKQEFREKIVFIKNNPQFPQFQPAFLIFNKIISYFGDPIIDPERKAINMYLGHQLKKCQDIISDFNKIKITEPLFYWDMPNMIGGFDRMALWDSIFNDEDSFKKPLNTNNSFQRKFSLHTFQTSAKEIFHRLDRFNYTTEEQLIEKLLTILQNMEKIYTTDFTKNWIKKIYSLMQNKQIIIPNSPQSPHHNVYFQSSAFLYNTFQYYNKKFFQVEPPIDATSTYSSQNLRPKPKPIYIEKPALSAITKKFTQTHPNYSFTFEQPWKNNFKSMDVDSHIISDMLTDIYEGLRKPIPELPACIVLGTSDIDYIHTVTKILKIGVPVILIYTKNQINQYFEIKNDLFKKFIIEMAEKKPIQGENCIQIYDSELLDYKSFRNNKMAKVYLTLMEDNLK